ncbi:DNA-binding SARP family transcriptional activator [Actinoplanes lutulentus]|uniref:AAA family ATPase n=1 Tax=Actinoplanes lutulentus TaxID=1287878 RepID=UPI00180E09DB|nr:AAA family ATPase [Actinoplanes lutulentus]MBB2948750.1 DNA-binding SARP family transcriptional activator [Actinoplanes lutulentus]
MDAGPRQQAYLLALLLARAGRPVSTSELMDLIWDDEVPSTALNVIQKYVGALRRLLEPAVPARTHGSYLHRRGNAYLFTAAPGMLDLVTFRELVEAAREALAQRRLEMALDRYVASLGLWRGPAGDGFTHRSTAQPIFTAIDDEFYAACTEAAELAVSLRRPARVLAALQLAASMAPFHEPVQAGLISVLGAAGRQREALSLFREVRARLADEIGIDPGPELQAAHLRVLSQSSNSPLVVRTEEGVGSASVRTAPGLVGRAEEIALLRESVEVAFAGRPALRIVEGEPGVGKTRLVREIATEADRRGALVVWGSCLEGDGTPSMWPWEQTLRPILDSLPTPLRESELGSLVEPRDDDAAAAWEIPGGGAQFRLFEQVVTVVGQASALRPLLLIIDDLQWADAASLQLFGHLAGRLPAGTVMIGVLRDRAPTPGSRLSRVLAEASRQPGHRRIRLGPLGVSDVTELIRRETGHDPGAEVARDIHARTAGNPFFVQELSRLLSDGGSLGVGGASVRAGVPATVRDVVRDRMTGLDDSAHGLLRLAAVIGRDVDLDLLARAIGADIADCLERLEPLQALGLLETTGDDPFSWRFAHDLVRESVTETTARKQTVQLHLRVADALEHLHADDESIAERLAYHLRGAGPLADPGRTAKALARAGHRAATKLAFAAAYRNLEAAVRIARTAGLPELELSVLSLLNLLAVEPPGMGGSTFDLLERGAYLARRLGRETAAAEFLFFRMTGAYVSTEKDRGMWARRLHEQGQSSADPIIQAYGRQAWGLYHWDIGDIGAAFQCFSWLGRTTVDGVASLLANSAGPHPGQAQESLYHLAGQVAGVPVRRRDDLGRWRIPDEWVGYLAVITTLHGDVETGRSLLGTVYQAEGDAFEMSGWTRYQTMAASMAGDAAWALHATERWVAAGAEQPGVAQEAYIRLDWHWARALTGDDPAGNAAEAEHLLAATLADPPRWGLAYWYGLIAEMWLAAAMPDRAAAALDRADQAVKAYGQRYAEGLLLLLRARLLHARGEPVSVVRAAADEARVRSGERGAHLFARRAESFLADLTCPRSGRPPSRETLLS